MNTTLCIFMWTQHRYILLCSLLLNFQNMCHIANTKCATNFDPLLPSIAKCTTKCDTVTVSWSRCTAASMFQVLTYTCSAFGPFVVSDLFSYSLFLVFNVTVDAASPFWPFTTAIYRQIRIILTLAPTSPSPVIVRFCLHTQVFANRRLSAAHHD